MNIDNFIETIDELIQNQNIEENTQKLLDFSNSIDNLSLCFSIITSDNYKAIYRAYSALYMEKIVNQCYISNLDLSDYANQLFIFLKELKNIDSFFYSNIFSLFGSIIRKGFIEDRCFNEAINEFFNIETVDPFFISKMLISIGQSFINNKQINNHDEIINKILSFVPFHFVKDSFNEFIKDYVMNDNILILLDLLLTILKMVKQNVSLDSLENKIESLHLYSYFSSLQGLIKNSSEITQWVELLNSILLSNTDEELSIKILDCILHFISFDNEKEYYPQIKNTIINLITRDDERNSSKEYLEILVFILYKYILIGGKIDDCLTGGFLESLLDFTTKNLIDISRFFEAPQIFEYCLHAWEALSNSQYFQYKKDEEAPLFQEFIGIYFDFLIKLCESNSELSKEIFIDDRPDKNPFITIIPIISVKHFTEFSISTVLNSFQPRVRTFITCFSSDSNTKPYTNEMDIQLCVLIKIIDSFFTQSSSYDDERQKEHLPVLVSAFIAFINETSPFLENYRKLQNGSDFLFEKTVLKLIDNLKYSPFFNYQSLCNDIIFKINTDDVQYTADSLYLVFIKRAIIDITIFNDFYEIIRQIVQILLNDSSIKCISKSDEINNLIYLRTTEEMSFLGELDTWELSFDFLKCISKLQFIFNDTELSNIVYDKLVEIESQSYSEGSELLLAIYLLNISSLLSCSSIYNDFISKYLNLDISLIPHMLEIIPNVMQKQKLIPIIFNHIKTLLKWMNKLKEQENYSSFQVVHYSFETLSGYLKEFKKAIDSKIDFDSLEDVFEMFLEVFDLTTKQLDGIIDYLFYYSHTTFQDIYSLLFSIIETVSIPNIIPYINLTNSLIILFTNFFTIYGKIAIKIPDSLLLILDFIAFLQGSPTRDSYQNLLTLISTIVEQIYNDKEKDSEEQVYAQLITMKEDTLRIIAFNIFKYFIRKGTNEGKSLFYLCQIGNYLEEFISMINPQIQAEKIEEFSQIIDKLRETPFENQLQWSLSLSKLFYFLNNMNIKIHV